MGFDFENFGIGLLAGWATGYAVYRARHRIKSAVDSITQQASSAQNYANQTADRRYINDLARIVEANHLAGRFFNLSDILVEPRFLGSSLAGMSRDEEDVKSVFHFIPVVPDHPYLLAPYNVETYSIDDLAAGGRALALLGRPGSGRTTALLAIVLRALGQAEFHSAPDNVQQRLDAEEAALDEKKRAVRIKDRVVLEQRAKEQLAKEQGTAFDAAEGQVTGSLFNRMMPVYVHLADINARDGEFGAEIDPAEPLVRTIQRQLGRIAASTMPESLYKRLSRGQVLFLIDGYDDLPESERSRQIAWLEALMSTYHENFFIVTGPAVGYGALTGRLGLTPLFMRPWSDRDMVQAADNWAEAWSKLGGKRRLKSAKPDAAVMERVKTNNRAFSPLDVTLKIWAGYADDAEAAGTEGWIRAYLARQLPPDQALGILLPQLAQLGIAQLGDGYITEAQLIARITGRPAVVDPAAEADDGKKGKSGKKDEKEQSAQGKLLSMLHRSGLLVRSVGGRYQFRHAFLAAYLASLTFKDAPAEQLASKAANPLWSMAIGYAALHSPIDEAVRVRLNAPADVLYKGVLEIANWLPYASVDAAWRVQFLKTVAGLFLSPNQYALVRERTAAVLAATRDKNAVTIFRQALKNSDPQLRRLGALGLGAIGDADPVDDLVARLKNDEDEDVQIAAAIGLMAIRTDPALTAVVEAFTEGSERLRQAIAETFADMPEEGYPVLYDAIQDQEMLLRRAAVLGLKRVKSTWALIAIYRAFLEDQQWYVRSAAQIAFQELQQGGEHGPRAYIPVDAMPWLTQWAARRGENVPPGESANVMLLKALQEGEPDIRVSAAAQLGQLGIASTTRALYAALRDKKSEVREAAHRSLAELELQIGKSLPAPL